MKQLILLTLLSASILGLKAQNRTDHPFQLQVNLSGFAINALGENLRKRDVIDLEVKEYTMPGLSVGYHLNSKFYVGYSFHPNRRYILRENYSFSDGPDDVQITLDHNSGTFHTLEGRFTPFSFGLYASAFFTHVSQARYDLTAVPIDEQYEVGNTFYEDAMQAQWNFKDMTTFGLGLGFNQVFANGFSFNLGAGIPVRFVKDLYSDVKVINQDNEFTQSDIQVIKDRIDGEDYYFPVQFYASVGLNF